MNAYLSKEAVMIRWKIVAGGELHPIQMYDLIYDEYDCKIRQIEIIPRTVV